MHTSPSRLMLTLIAGIGLALPALAQPASPPGANSATTPAAKPAGTYSGHGASSVSPEVLARFAPTPLPPELARHIQSMLDVRGPGGGTLSPDGKTLFFTWSVTGTTQIWRLDGPQRFPVQMTGGEDRTTVSDVLPDGSALIVSRDRNGEENPGLYLQDVKGGPLKAIQHQPDVQTFFEYVTDDSRYIYFTANDVKRDSFVLYRWDRKTEQREVIFDQPGLWHLADLRKDGRMLLNKSTGALSSEYFEYEPATKKLTPLFGQGEQEEYLAMYASTPDELLVLTPKLGEFRRLYRWKAGQLTPLTPEMKHDVAYFGQDLARARIYYQINDDGFTRTRVLDGKTFKEVPLPKLPPADHVTVTSVSRDGRYAMFSLDPGTGPSLHFVYDWKTRALTQWATPSTPEIDTTRFSRAQLEFYPARDGTKIPMLVRRPAKCAEPCPVVVHFHGGPEGQSVPGYSSWAQLFVDAGFVFVEPNVRGSDGYGKTWLHADDGPKRLNVITDIEDASKYIRTAWAKDGKAPRIGIFGGSYGGYSTQIGMTMFAGAYDAGVAIVGMSNLLTFLQNTAPYRRILRASEYGDPEKDHDALVKLSPITYIDRIKGPLLLIQGASDPRVPVGEALQIYQALEKKKIPTGLIIFADEGHGAAKRGNIVFQLGHALRFFQEHLQGVTPATASTTAP